MALALAAVVVVDHDLAGTRDDDEVALALVTWRISAEKRMVPADFDSICEAAAVRDAAPPMWNVRIVSCVPGSPIDCAAMTPTASPTLTR